MKHCRAAARRSWTGVMLRPSTAASGRGRTPSAATRRRRRQVSLPPPSRGRVGWDQSSTVTLVQLRDRQAIGLGANLHRFLAAGQRPGDRLQRHALLREHMQLVDLGRGPWLFVAFEAVLHAMTSASALAARMAIASSRPWNATI